jgi:hypothetical protein
VEDNPVNDATWLIIAVLNAVLVIGLAALFVVLQLRGGLSARGRRKQSMEAAPRVALIIAVALLLIGVLVMFVLKSSS